MTNDEAALAHARKFYQLPAFATDDEIRKTSAYQWRKLALEVNDLGNAILDAFSDLARHLHLGTGDTNSH